jgi:hypothetical protein
MSKSICFTLISMVEKQDSRAVEVIHRQNTIAMELSIISTDEMLRPPHYVYDMP